MKRSGTSDGENRGFWDILHRSRLEPTAKTVACDDCGEEFPIETDEQRERLSDGCPACNPNDYNSDQPTNR